MSDPRPGQAGLSSAAVSADPFVAEGRSLRPVHELVRDQALRQPEAPALPEMSYRELDSWADHLALSIVNAGVTPRTAVAIRLSAGPKCVVAMLATMRAGCFIVPLGDEPILRCVEILRDANPGCLLVDADDAADEQLDLLRRDRPVRVVEVGEPGDGPPSRGELPVVAADDPVYLVYTSGSTGTPKGILQSHRSLAQFLLWMGHEFRMGPGRRIAQWSGPTYDASLCEIFAPLVAGGTVCVVPSDIRTDAASLLAWMGTGGVNLLQTVPSFGRELRHALEQEGAIRPMKSLDHLLFAGELLDGALVSGFANLLPGVRLVNLYGATETILATWWEITGKWSGPVPIGWPIPGRRVLVLDEDDRPCSVSETGEIVVCSPFLTLGYVGTAGSSQSGFGSVTLEGGVTVPCYRTGDRGRFRPDGLLEFRGRLDAQVKLRGVRVELAEIEAALAKHPSVLDCAVVPAVDAEGLTGRLVAFIVPGSALGSPRRWRAHLRRHLTERMMPSSFVTVSSLPRTAGGKIDRARLPVPGESRSDNADPAGISSTN